MCWYFFDCSLDCDFFLSSIYSQNLPNDHDLLWTSVKRWAVWGTKQGSCSPKGNIEGEQWNPLWSPNNRVIWATQPYSSSLACVVLQNACISEHVMINYCYYMYLSCVRPPQAFSFRTLASFGQEIWSVSRSIDRTPGPVWCPHPKLLRGFCFQLSLSVYSQFSCPPPSVATSTKKWVLFFPSSWRKPSASELPPAGTDLLSVVTLWLVTLKTLLLI